MIKRLTGHILSYISRKTGNMSAAEIKALQHEINSLLDSKINELENHGFIKKCTPKKIASHHSINRNVEIVKAYINGETQKNIAKKHNVSSTRVSALYNNYKRFFHRFLLLNCHMPPSMESLALNKLTDDIKAHFLWYLDHHEIVMGYKLDSNIHVPASKKLISQEIADANLPENIKYALEQSNFKNMSEVAQLSYIQIRNIPMVNRAMTTEIMNYFMCYISSAS